MQRNSYYAGDATDLFIAVVGESTVQPLALAPRHQNVPEIAAAGALKLVVWAEYLVREARTVVNGMRVSADGDPARVRAVPHRRRDRLRQPAADRHER